MTFSRHVVQDRTASLRTLGSAAFFTGFGDILGKSAVLVTTLFAARALPPTEFASFAGLLAVCLFAAVAWDCGFSTLVTREVAAANISTSAAVRAAVHARARTFALWALTLVAGVLILPGVSVASLAAFGAASGLAASSMIPLALLRSGLRFQAATLAQVVGRCLTALLTGLTLWAFGAGHGLAMLGIAAVAGEGTTLILACSLFRFRPQVSVVCTMGQALKLRAAIPFAANGLLSTAYNRLDVVLVAWLTTATELGRYAPASRLQDILYLVPSSLGLVLMPLLASALAKRANDAEILGLMSKVIAIGLLVTIPISGLLFVYAPTLLIQVLGQDYSGATIPIRITVWSMPIAAIGAPVLAVLIARGSASDTTVAFIAAFVAALALHFMLDSWLGGIGAAISAVVRDIVNVAVLLTCLVLRRTESAMIARSPVSSIAL